MQVRLDRRRREERASPEAHGRQEACLPPTVCLRSLIDCRYRAAGNYRAGSDPTFSIPPLLMPYLQPIQYIPPTRPVGKMLVHQATELLLADADLRLPDLE